MEPKRETPPHIKHRARMRGKFASGGLDVFLDHEALEFILTYVIPRRDTKPAAWALLKRFHSLSGVLDAKEEELCDVEGIGRETALYIRMMRGLIRRYFLDDIRRKPSITTPEDAAGYCRASLEGERDEIFEVIYLTTRNTVIACDRIAEGTIDRTAISPRKIVENAISRRAAAMIFVHNHPSGDPTPSDEDVGMTYELVKAAATLGLKVHDHLIIGKGGYFSFKSSGLLDKDKLQ